MAAFRTWLLLGLVALTLASFVRAHGGHDDEEEQGEASYDADSPVKVLTGANFDESVNNLAKLVLVEFYAPWCGHCKSLKPIYEATARTIKKRGDIDAVLCAMDATENRDLAKKFGVQGFPTLKLFQYGKLVGDYDGGRTSEDILNYLESYLQPALVEIKTQEELDRFAQDRMVYALGHFSEENAPAQKAFSEAAEVIRKAPGYESMRFAEVKSSSLANDLGLAATPALKVYRQFPGVTKDDEPAEVEFDFFTEEGFNAEKITAFLKGRAFPATAEITPQNFGFYEKRALPLFWGFVPGHGKTAPYGSEEPAGQNTPTVQKEQDEAIRVLRAVGEKYLGRLSFVWLSGEDYGDHAESLGVSVSAGLPNGLFQEVVDGRDGAKFLFNTSNGFTEASLGKFAQEYLDGKLARFIKSEPIPEKNDDPVTVVVGRTFDKLVYESDNDVFIEFYAPWCGHCKALTPVWEKLATLLKGVPGITIAKIDATANDVPKNVQGFPTIYFKKASNKEKKLADDGFYDGSRSFDDFVRYLKEHSSADLSNLKVPSDVNRLKSFIEQFDLIKADVQRLIEENEELKAKLGIKPDAPVGGSNEAQYDQDPHAHHHHGHDHHGHDHDHDEL